MENLNQVEDMKYISRQKGKGYKDGFIWIFQFKGKRLKTSTNLDNLMEFRDGYLMGIGENPVDDTPKAGSKSATQYPFLNEILGTKTEDIPLYNNTEENPTC